MNERAIRDAWEKFVSGAEIGATVRSAVAGSWERSRNFKVDVASHGPPVLSEAELYRRRTDSALLAASARQAMERASQILSETWSMLILTDGSGHIIATAGDRREIERGREVHLEDGGCWSEEKIGTNAIGAAMAVKQPIQIHATEHFCEHIQRWTCAAAPIFHPIDRELMGVIDISGPPLTFSAQNLALVVSIADHMESLVSQAIEAQHARLLTCFQEKQRKWASHDLMAVDRRGGLVHATPNALRKLAHYFGPQTHGRDLSHLRSLPFEDWPVDLGGRMANARTVLVKDGDDELGAIVVFPTMAPSSSTALNAKTGKRAAGAPPEAFIGAIVQHRSPEEIGFDAGDPPRRAREGSRRDPKERGGALPNFVASDPKVRQICNNVAAAARLRLPILICGETGTGKEELARFAHAASGRTGPFVPVNCAALPDSLIESELFGYAEGAFTGARKGGARGLAREADGGTLFLDEIGDMAYALQSTLLRFLDDFTVRPIGGAAGKIDVLVVSATNSDLGAAVASRRFRADLLYRLNTMQITLPPLEERVDFSEIVLHLLGKIDPCVAINASTVAGLARRSWPGHIRELRSVLARLSLMASARDNVIDDRLLDALVTAPPASALMGGSLRAIRQARILAAYAETGGNISETARRLGVCRNTVYRALESSGES